MVKSFMRFGRRRPVPSSVQIKHELRNFCAQEDVREECAVRQGMPSASTWDEIYAHRAAETGAATKPAISL
jgi:hypothetical protein